MDVSSIENLINGCKDKLSAQFAEVDDIALYNQEKVLNAFIKNKVALRHFNGTTGYGYDDIGRDTLERIYARIFHTEASLMRPHIASGTAALSLTLFGMTKPGETILSATGMPYDTLQRVIGIGAGPREGSLKEMGIQFTSVELKDGRIDVEATEKAITQIGRAHV